jgi:hypothetical protein
MSVLDGLWRLGFFMFCVVRVMLFAMGEGVPQFIVYKCVVCSMVSGVARDAVVDFDA